MKPQRNLPVNVPVKNTKGDELGTLQSKVSYIDGKSEGLYVKYNENGQVEYKGNYKNGKQDGRWYVLKLDGTVDLLKRIEVKPERDFYCSDQ